MTDTPTTDTTGDEWATFATVADPAPLGAAELLEQLRPDVVVLAEKVARDRHTLPDGWTAAVVGTTRVELTHPDHERRFVYYQPWAYGEAWTWHTFPDGALGEAPAVLHKAATLGEALA